MENLFDKFSFVDAGPFASDKFTKATNGNDGDKFSFVDAGPFAYDKFTKDTNGNDGNNNFDPFGAPINGNKKETSSTGFGFEADFANFDAFNSTGTRRFSGGAKNGSLEGFDAWSTSIDKTNNNVSSGKTKKNKQQPEVSKINKFSADYSDKVEDLEQVLQRSLVEQ